MGGVVGGIQAVLPTAFDPLPESVDDGISKDFQSPSFETCFPSDGENVSPDVTSNALGGDDDSAAVKSAVAAVRLRSTAAMHPDDSALLTVLLPLLARLPPVCPPVGRSVALPSLLLLSVRIVGSITGDIVVKGSGLNTRDSGTGRGHLTTEARAAVEFVRASVREIWKHGDVTTDSVGDVQGGLGDVNNDFDEKGAQEAAVEDDWGDEDFQGADETTEEVADTAATVSIPSKNDGSLVEVGEASGQDSVLDHSDEKDGIVDETEAVSSTVEDLDVSPQGDNASGAVDVEEVSGGGNEKVVPADGEQEGQVVEDGDDSDTITDIPKEVAPIIAKAGQEPLTSNSNLQTESDPVYSVTDINDGGGSSGGSIPLVPNARSLILGAGRAVNELLEDLLRRGGSVGRYSRASPGALATAIGVAAEVWGAIASEVPGEAEGLSGPLRTALSCPVESCSVAARHALFGAVAATVAATSKDEGDSNTTEGKRAAGVMLRMLVPHALAGLRVEIDRAASAPTNGRGVRGEEERAREACILEGVRVAQIAFKVRNTCVVSMMLSIFTSFSCSRYLPLPVRSFSKGFDGIDFVPSCSNESKYESVMKTAEIDICNLYTEFIPDVTGQNKIIAIEIRYVVLSR